MTNPIRTARLALGLSQQQLAEALGYASRVTVWRWEHGDVKPRKAITDRINAMKLKHLESTPMKINWPKMKAKHRKALDKLLPPCGEEP